MANAREPQLIGAVLDTSVIVAGFLSKRGASAEILWLWEFEQRFQLVFSDSILVEFTGTLLKKGVPESQVLALIEAIHEEGFSTADTYIVNAVPTDPDDNIFLATALEGEAGYLVSLDKHLLSLKHYRGVEIVWPKDFLKLIRK